MIEQKYVQELVCIMTNYIIAVQTSYNFDIPQIYNKMNYFKNFLAGSADKKQQTKLKTQKQYELSGQFQIIEPDDEQFDKSDEKQLNLEQIERQYISIKSASQQQAKALKQTDSKYYSDPIQIIISSQSDKCQQLIQNYDIIQKQDKQTQLQASTIKIDDYFMLVDNKDLNKQFQTQEQWFKFYQKIKIESDKHNKKCLTINFQELNSILSIHFTNLQKREQYWNKIAKCDIHLKSTRLLTNCKDLKKMQMNLLKIQPTIQILLQNKYIIQNNLKTSLKLQLQNQEFQNITENIKIEVKNIQKMILQTLKLYGGNDAQIGYSKGLEYVALGVIVSKPKCSLAQLKSDFKYLMFKKQLRNMYFPGTPKLYEQINVLEECMQSQVPRIRERLHEINGDLMKVFIGYYKTYLIYKVTDIEVISKIFQLLLLYGIDLVRIILIRIMCKKQDFILQIDNQEKLMQYLAQNLISDYFKKDQQILVSQKDKEKQIKGQISKKQHKSSNIIQKFKNLFVTKDIL